MKEEINEILLKDEGFFKSNNYQLEEANKDKITLKAPITKESKNIYGITHGGFIFGLGDHAMGILASLDKRKSVTLNANINFISPGISRQIQGRPAHRCREGREREGTRARGFS